MGGGRLKNGSDWNLGVPKLTGKPEGEKIKGMNNTWDWKFGIQGVTPHKVTSILGWATSTQGKKESPQSSGW